MTFKEFGFDERIQKGIDEAGFVEPMPVQAECFKFLINEHRDVYAQSQTGTGKTAAFCLGIFQLITSEESFKNEKSLIIVPTRELAVQIERECNLLGKYLNLRIGAVFGGMGFKSQEAMLKKGLDILIGTPGRLIDFGNRKVINFKEYGFLVIDEADRLFDMGFLPDLKSIIGRMRPSTERRTLLFSATLNSKVGNLAWEYMSNPGEIIIEPEKTTVDTVTQEIYHVSKNEKMQLLLGIMKKSNPENAVIFTNTRHSAWEVAKRLKVNGYEVTSLMGDLPQKQRMKIVDGVKKGHHRFLVSTDVASRGLHIDELEMVINYDLPLDAESYIHRIGRTARAGKKGKTITMACEEYIYGLGPIEKLLGKKIPVKWADESLYLKDESANTHYTRRDRYRGMDGNSKKTGNQSPRKQPRKGMKFLDPGASRVQSAVSSVAGGKLEDLMLETRSTDNQEQRPQRDRGKQKSQSSPRKSSKDRKPKTENKQRKAPPGATIPEAGGKRIDSNTSIDKRLEYYRKKYGDNFSLDSNESSNQKKKGLLGRLLGK